MANLYMMCGVSGSGKSTWADVYAKVYHAQVFSSDAIRAELFGDENNQKYNSQVFNVLHERVRSALIQGKDCVYDATNLNRKRRIAFLNSLEDIENLEKTIIICAAPFSECVARDTERARTVGRPVIERQVSQFQIPLVEEGWDDISVLTLKDIDGQASSYQLDKFLLGQTPHNCAPYHLETIEAHMKTAYLLAKINDEPDCIQIALKYHDIGKLFTQKWDEKKCRNTFYGHQNWSTYLYLCSSTYFDLKAKNEEEAFVIATLISEHMEPHLSSWSKKKTFYGKNFRELLKLMANYDDWASIKNERE